jgi:hypothetical protein
MKDAATNQVHHGMGAEDMLFTYAIRETPIIGTTSAESAKRQVGQPRLGIDGFVLALSVVCILLVMRFVRINLTPCFAEERLTERLARTRSARIVLKSSPGKVNGPIPVESVAIRKLPGYSLLELANP